MLALIEEVLQGGKAAGLSADAAGRQHGVGARGSTRRRRHRRVRNPTQLRPAQVRRRRLLNLRLAPVWCRSRDGHHADAPDGDHRRHPAGEPLLRAAGRDAARDTGTAAAACRRNVNQHRWTPTRAGADDAQALRRCRARAGRAVDAVGGLERQRPAADRGRVERRSLPLPAGGRSCTSAWRAETARRPSRQPPRRRDRCRSERVEILSRTLEPLLTTSGTDAAATMPTPFGGGPLRLVVTPLGLGGDCGVVVVGSPQPDFPAPPTG